MIVLFLFLAIATGGENQDLNVSKTMRGVNVKELILEHLADSYEWHLFNTKKNSVTIHLPVILYSKTSGWNIFLSSKLHNNDNNYKGFGIATEGKYKGKIVETSSSGEEVRPFDLSITKNAASLLLSSLILILIILGVSQSIKRDPLKPKKGFAGIMEMFIFMIVDEVIKPAIGEDYKRYSPYLLTLFFFIFFNNLLGLFPLFQRSKRNREHFCYCGVSNRYFSRCQFNWYKKYYKELFWPDTPVWLKVPFPLMQILRLLEH